jgi:signal transduction histidine kinase
MGQDVRAWPMLALLVMVVLVAVGCVLWFMREAMHNERVAVREKLVEAYRGRLALVRAQALDRWSRWRTQHESAGPAPANFARCLREHLADSVICFDDHGLIAYPRGPHSPNHAVAQDGDSTQSDLRALVQGGKPDEAIRFVIERFPVSDSAHDAEGRLMSANAELLALELINNRADPRFAVVARRLRDRASDYSPDSLPSAQRRFIMHEMRRLDPDFNFPTLAAEDLAAQYLENAPEITAESAPHATKLRDIWTVPSANHRVLALLAVASFRAKLEAAILGPPLPKGVGIAILAPGEETAGDAPAAILPLGSELPGWRLALFLDDRSLFDTEAAKRLRIHVAVASLVIASLSCLAILIARGLSRQVAMARLKNDLVATVSHELKTPLAAMRALVDTLLETEKFDERTTREYLQLLAQENARLTRVIDNFLTFSRLERKKFRFVFARLEPQAVVDGALAALGDRRHSQGCHIETRSADHLPIIVGDADALITALLNLLDNAWKYSGNQKRIALLTEAHGGKVCFSVEDNGIGISRDESRHIFRRFYQADQRLSRAAGGCGLGLTIVHSIVEAHRGSISVASEIGKGSTFTMEIPVTSSSNSTSA